MEATAPEDQHPVADADEVLALLSEAARAGSVTAMKELRAHFRERSGLPAGSLGAIDELVARRGASGLS